MSIDRELRNRLIDLADEVRVPATPDMAVHRRVRAVRRRRTALAGSALLTVAVVATSMVLAGVVMPRGGDLTAAPGDGPFLAWNRVGDAPESMVDDAKRAWDQARPGNVTGAHTEVRALLTAEDPHLGRVVVLQAYDGAGQPRIGFFVASSTAGPEMRLLADRPAPVPEQTRVVSLVSPRAPAGSFTDSYWSGYAIAVAMPGVTRLQITSTSIDDEMVEGGGAPTGRYLIRRLPQSSTALTVRVKGFAGGESVFDSPAQGGAVGDAEYLPAIVTERRADHLTVSVAEAGRVRTGQLVAVAHGLVGQVAQVDPAGREARVQLLNAAGFEIPAYTDISNQPGVLRQRGGLVFGDLAPTSEVNEGNRLLVADPAQHDPLAGAITAAHAAKTRTSGQVTVPARPAVSIDGLREVFISVPALSPPA
ncbi:rod shape-determining protein MreC [Micromonospora inyonensis]|uniref:Rod shape-determining protein MreC n=1 Tax=Micromonospora inyonensis TaxID=47866 RepID=A0A1C6SEU2_9ACTN|nr:rod shape-determining protein MreC [Micromonospora inyonensis]SCL28005.1 rod shape-determining protein MreC [Micromonospora inyonensis]